MRIRKDDMVVVIAGRDRGQRGKVLKVDRTKNKVYVEGLNRVYKHVRKSNRNPQGGRLSKEAGIDASNVMLICPTTGKPTRTATRIYEDGSKVLVSKRSKSIIRTVSAPRKGERR